MLFRSTSITGRVYDRHTYAAEISLALESWGRKLEGILAGKQPDNVVNITGRKK